MSLSTPSQPPSSKLTSLELNVSRIPIHGLFLTGLALVVTCVPLILALKGRAASSTRSVDQTDVYWMSSLETLAGLLLASLTPKDDAVQHYPVHYVIWNQKSVQRASLQERFWGNPL